MLTLTVAGVSLFSACDLSVGFHTPKVLLLPGDPVHDSPGLPPGSSSVACNRLHVHGISRLRNLTKFAHSLRLNVSIIPYNRAHNVEICAHRNLSTALCTCPPGQWQKIHRGGVWVQSISPFEGLVLDIRSPSLSPSTLEASTLAEFMIHRVVFLVLGAIMMAMARFLSESVVFYYGSAMAVGIMLVILIVLYQGMRLLPTGRKSSLAIFIYSSILGVATFLLQYISGLLRSLLLEIGISEDMHNPLGIMLLVCLALSGGWFGYWGIRKFVLTEEGLVDSDVAFFVEWAIVVFSAVMILQCSLDNILALEALLIVFVVTRTQKKFRLLRLLCRYIGGSVHAIARQFSLPRISNSDYSDHSRNSDLKEYRSRNKRQKQDNNFSDLGGFSVSRMAQPSIPYGEETYYSTFHKTPERRKFSKEDWEAATKEHTSKALRELVASPDFSKWAVANADRIMLSPPDHHRHNKRKGKWFNWF